MPYIKEAVRETIETPYVTDDGQLTYVMCRMAEELLSQRCDYDWSNLSYAKIAQVLGDMEAAKLEFGRRILAAYEDGKLVENGDVFEAPAHIGATFVEAVQRRAAS